MNAGRPLAPSPPSPPPSSPPPSVPPGSSPHEAPRPFTLDELDQALSEKPRRRRARTWLKWGAIGAVTLVALTALTVVLVIRYFEAGLPSVGELRTGYHPPQVTRVLSAEGTTLATLFTERRTVVPFSSIPDAAKLAFLAAEDAVFYEHDGLNYWGMLRALAANLRAGKTRQGGSTITQQVIKNVLLDPERTYSRKIRETILARRLEQQLSKDEILGLYLNHIYFGHRRYGLEEAARYYFGRRSAELELTEAALLAGIVAAPEHFTPRKYPERALSRRAYVLDQMLEKGFVTAELHRYAKASPLRLAPELEAESDLAPEVLGIVKQTLERAVGERAHTGGFTVETTLDAELQAAARDAVRRNLDRYLERQKLAPPYTLRQRRLWGPAFSGDPEPHHIYVGNVVELMDDSGRVRVRVGNKVLSLDLRAEQRYNPKHLKPTEFTEVGAALRVGVEGELDADGDPRLHLELGPQSALVAIDVRTRNVVALIGSYEALPFGLNRALQARRQPGSAFKPFVYSYALTTGRFTLASMFQIDVPNQAEPRSLSLRQAVAESQNDVVREVFRKVGARKVVAWAHKLGIESALGADESLALGAYEVTPLEITNAFATFASGGELAQPHFIETVTNGENKKLALPAREKPRRVLSPEGAYLVTSLLRSVVESGTAKRAAALGRPLAGKTGTTNRAKDAWFVGYSTDLVVGVWVGYDDALPLGSGESGAVTALPAWVDFMKRAERGHPATEFARPSGVVVVPIDVQTGLLPSPAADGSFSGEVRSEEFLDGTVPEARAPAPEPVEPLDQGAEDPNAPVGETGDAPSSGEPSNSEQPSGDRPNSEVPSGEQPNREQPSGEQPSADEPSSDDAG